MTRESCIEHRRKAIAAIVREDYYRMTNCDRVAASILNIFEYWANGEIAKNHGDLSDVIDLGERTIAEIEEMSLWEATDKTIREKLSMLARAGWISIRREGRYSNSTSYSLNVARIQDSLNKIDWSIPLKDLRSQNPRRKKRDKNAVNKEEINKDSGAQTKTIDNAPAITSPIALKADDVSDGAHTKNSQETTVDAIEWYFESTEKFPFLNADDIVPRVIIRDMHLRGLKFPWKRDRRINDRYQSYLPEFINYKARIWANSNKQGDRWENYIPATIQAIQKREKTIGGLESLIAEWNTFTQSQKQEPQAEQNQALEEKFNTMHPFQHELIYRDFRKSASIEDFVQAKPWHSEWLSYAQATYPDWDWGTTA